MSIPGPSMLMHTLFVFLRKLPGTGDRQPLVNNIDSAAKLAINNSEEAQKQLQEQQKKTNS